MAYSSHKELSLVSTDPYCWPPAIMLGDRAIAHLSMLGREICYMIHQVELDNLGLTHEAIRRWVEDNHLEIADVFGFPGNNVGGYFYYD